MGRPSNGPVWAKNAFTKLSAAPAQIAIGLRVRVTNPCFMKLEGYG